MKNGKNGEQNRLNFKNQRRIYLLPLIVVFIGICMAGGILAKYRMDLQKQSGITASDFHFTSDLLEENGASYTLTDWSDGFDIELYNYEKENTALISDQDITYKVTLSDNTNWLCKDKNDGKLEKDSNGKAKSQTIHISPQTGAKDGSSVIVTVKSTSPFTKTLSATFKMEGSNTPSYTIEDQKDGTVLLTIKTNNYSSNINVSWNNEKFDPDNTNVYMADWKDIIGNGTLKASSNTTYSLLFFKNTTDHVTEENGSGTSISLSE